MGTSAACEVGGVEWEREPKLALDSERRENKERKKKECPLKRKSLFDSLATRDIYNPAKSSRE